MKDTCDYQLPNGKRTTSADRYVREWRKLMQPFAKTFGLRRHACDPAARFQTLDGRETFDVPLEMLRRFNRDILPNLDTKAVAASIEANRETAKRCQPYLNIGNPTVRWFWRGGYYTTAQLPKHVKKLTS